MRCAKTLTLGLVGAVAMAASVGCVRRTILVTSEPAGALVYLNDVEVGRTPVEVDFLYYGEYDVRLVLEGHEPLLTSGQARAPWWETVGIDLIAEALPGEPHSRIHWHYDLEASRADSSGTIERARAMRDRLGPAPALPAEPEADGATTPADAPTNAESSSR